MDIEWVWIFRNKTWILFKSSDHTTLATYAMNPAPYSSANRFFLNMVFVIVISFDDDDSPLLWLYTLCTLSSYVPSLQSFS
ncbi:hypothetical protein HanPI659440_Chr13g0481861 [Helianthus annuus]|nr:hypothetical protein HanPI659440_Chr13g0481861 [Helianthus annuus]